MGAGCSRRHTILVYSGSCILGESLGESLGEYLVYSGSWGEGGSMIRYILELLTLFYCVRIQALQPPRIPALHPPLIGLTAIPNLTYSHPPEMYNDDTHFASTVARALEYKTGVKSDMSKLDHGAAYLDLKRWDLLLHTRAQVGRADLVCVLCLGGWSRSAVVAVRKLTHSLTRPLTHPPTHSLTHTFLIWQLARSYSHTFLIWQLARSYSHTFLIWQLARSYSSLLSKNRAPLRESISVRCVQLYRHQNESERIRTNQNESERIRTMIQAIISSLNHDPIIKSQSHH